MPEEMSKEAAIDLLKFMAEAKPISDFDKLIERLAGAFNADFYDVNHSTWELVSLPLSKYALIVFYDGKVTDYILFSLDSDFAESIVKHCASLQAKESEKIPDRLSKEMVIDMLRFASAAKQISFVGDLITRIKQAFRTYSTKEGYNSELIRLPYSQYALIIRVDGKVQEYIWFSLDEVFAKSIAYQYTKICKRYDTDEVSLTCIF